jgi:hypothetical protein
MKLIERMLVGPMMRHQASKRMFCSGCEEVLDSGKAVSLDLYKGDTLFGTRMICADCADLGAIRKARMTGRVLDPSFRLNVIDGRLVDPDDIFHPPAQTYRVGPKGRFTTQTSEGPKQVRGMSVTLMHPVYAAHERWFAYAIPVSATHCRTWCFVHEATGFAAGKAYSLRGCIHSGLSRLLRADAEAFEKSISKARRMIAKAG